MTGEYMTTREVLERLGVSQNTLTKYARMLGINGMRKGRSTLYTREEVEQIKTFTESPITLLIAAVEKKTGRKVKLV